MRGRDPRLNRAFGYLRRGPDTVKSDVDEELNVHLDMRREELKARGFPDDDARREALRQFGDLEATREYCRQQDHGKENTMRRTLMLEDLTQDFKICFRALRRAPMMTLTIVATVGLGIGATTAIFSAINAALLRPLPYANPGELVRFYTDAPPNIWRFSLADYLALEAQQTQFAQVAAYTDRSMAFSDGTTAERFRGRVVTWTYFGLLGIRPAAGRDFTAADGRPGTPPSIIVSHGFWQQRLGGRDDLIGKPIRFDGTDYTLVGVLPQRVGPLEQPHSFFVAAQWTPPPRKGPFFYTAIGRLRDGASRSAAAEELRAINKRIFPIWRASYQDDKATWAMMDLRSYVVGDVNTIAGLALSAVALVWLIACANASNLLIARVTSRRRELAVRTALGASRGRVVRYLLAESALLALGAAAVGVGLTYGGIALLRNFGATYFPRTQEIAVDGAALGVLALLTAGSAVLFGLIPAIHGAGGPPQEALQALGRSTTGTVAVRRLRRLLVGTQFAIATPLLVGAGLLTVTLSALGRVELGFDTTNMISGAIQLPVPQYQQPERATAFWDELRRRVAAIPGVAGVTLADGRPPVEVGNFNNFDLEDTPTAPGHSQPVTPWVGVTPEYFRVLGLTLMQGEIFDESEGRKEALESVVVDRAWASRFFPNQSAIGKRFHQGGCTTCPWTRVVGVVSEVKYAGLDAPDHGTVYWPLGPQERTRFLILRTRSDPSTVLPAVRQTIRDLDAGLPFSNVATMDELVTRSLQTPRSLSVLVGSLAIVALLLSLVGIYGVMAYYVQQHAKDIGIRVALGGSRGELLRLIVGQGMKVVATGIVVGVAAAFALTRLMSNLLFGVTASDAVTFASVTIALLTVALVACFVPARRAVGVEPSAVLRND
jgi:putative ABC transport system permease protein